MIALILDSGETHGCPYVHYGEAALKQALRKKFAPEQIEEIVQALHSSSTGAQKNAGVSDVYDRVPAERRSF